MNPLLQPSRTCLALTLACTAWLPLAAQAAAVSPLSYSMINGGGQSSGGTFNYWDAGYTGSGAATTDGAFLSGGLGKLTDGVIATQRWDSVSNNAGTGQYVGWRQGLQSNPLITFNFASGVVINAIDIYIDNSQFGGVFSPSSILIDGLNAAFVAPVGNGIKLAFAGLNLTGLSHTIQLNQAPGTWVFVSEVTFDGGNATLPEPGSLALTGLALTALAAAGAVRKGRRAAV